MISAAWLNSAAAADRSNRDSSASQTSVSSVGKNGSSLKWLSHRPVMDKAVKPVQYAEPAEPPAAESGATTSKPNPFGDPFGDKKKKTAAPAPAEKRDMESPPILSEEPKLPKERAPAKELPGKTPVPVKETPSVESKKTDTFRLETERNGKQLESSSVDIFQVCPSAREAKNIKELTTNIVPPEGDLPHDCPLGNDIFQQRRFSPITYTWTASGLCHKPLYFEDVQLERYGHMAGPWVQPFASGAHFFATIPILPYKMGLEPPGECMYTLGYYRPGSCAPYLFDPIPLSVRGALFEAGAWVGGCFMFP
jgi:hypothetical protein